MRSLLSVDFPEKLIMLAKELQTVTKVRAEKVSKKKL
jgi:hypothetical protein